MNKGFRIVTRHGEADRLPFASSVTALGTFDGVHIAHRRLIQAASELRIAIGAESFGVWCFEESPAAVLRQEDSVMLSTADEKIKLLLECGVDFVAVARFECFREMKAEDFITGILKKELSCIGTVCGYDHRFGHMGLGDTLLLRESFESSHTVTVNRITVDGETVSSSAIREHIKMGKIEKANKMLGRALSFTSAVSSGKQLGRKLGFPTANQALPQGLTRLPHGVYATKCCIDGEKKYIGVSNIGIRPSIGEGDDHRVNCETYIVGFEGELYGKSMTVEFCSFLRKEKRFESLEALTAAIEKDKNSAIEYFLNNRSL